MNAFSGTGAAFAALCTLIGVVLGAMIRTRAPLAKIKADSEANLLKERAVEMADMRKRIEKLEDAIDRKDEKHVEEIRALEAKQAAKDRYYAAMVRAYVHSKNNMTTAFGSLLSLLKNGVALEQAISEVEDRLARDAATEAAEVATIRAAAIKAGIAEPEL